VGPVSALEVWDLDDVAETVYRAMLRNPDLDVEGLARHLELADQQVTAAVERLTGVGLVAASTTTPSGIAPAPPATTLTAMLHTALEEMETQRARLDAVRAALAGFAADHMVGQSRSWSSMPVELLSAEESFAAVEDLQRGTVGDIVSCHQAIHIDVDAPTYVELLEHQLRAGRRMRGLYPADVMEDERRIAYVHKWAVAGEQVRLSLQPLPTLAVFGTEVAMVSASEPDEPGAGRILVRAPALVSLVTLLFEQYWERSLPLGVSDDGQAADDRHRILELLVAGTKDESIARQLGLSLRTVRRRVAELMDELGARTRFQAGVEAARRGLL
jgi:DNA-binding CsgD family transcriptional regulator